MTLVFGTYELMFLKSVAERPGTVRHVMRRLNGHQSTTYRASQKMQRVGFTRTRGKQPRVHYVTPLGRAWLAMSPRARKRMTMRTTYRQGLVEGAALFAVVCWWRRMWDGV